MRYVRDGGQEDSDESLHAQAQYIRDSGCKGSNYMYQVLSMKFINNVIHLYKTSNLPYVEASIIPMCILVEKGEGESSFVKSDLPGFQHCAVSIN